MKPFRIAVMFVVGIAAIALAGDKLTPSTLLKNVDKYHEKPVVVTGKVSDFQQKTSRAGNKYFVFKMKEGEDVIGVYSQGEANPVLKDGDKVEINGIYRKEKKVTTFTVKNEVDITKVKEKPYGFKKID